MSKHYTDEDVERGADAIMAPRVPYEWHLADARKVLDAVAPSIAARALREAADGLEAFFGIEIIEYKIAAGYLHARANEIEAQP